MSRKVKHTYIHAYIIYISSFQNRLNNHCCSTGFYLKSKFVGVKQIKVMVIRKSFWKVASLSKNVATLCMMADDHVASSVASDILIVNQ